MVRLSKITAEDCRFALAAATQVIAYHFIIDGRLILTVEGEPPIEVRAGEVVLLPRNEASVRFTASELINGRFASPNIMSRLSELLLVEAVRDYSSTLGGQEAGWLKGLADPQVDWTLALIHRNIGLSWSAEALAKAVALSRSAFVDCFTALVGMPPIRYRTVWRLQTAKLNLQERRTPIAKLAHSVGYESEEAFSRAFKREFGVPPARWRDQQSSA
jgi:AraC-like DNA-binding protein